MQRGRTVLAMDCVLAGAQLHRGRPLNSLGGSKVISRLISYWRETAKIERPYRESIRAVMIGGPIMLTIISIPSQGWSLFGHPMSWMEMWRSGAFISVAIFVGLCTAAAWGLAARKAPARWLGVAAPLLAAVVFPVSVLSNPWAAYFWAVLLSGATYLALFRSASYRQYLGLNARSNG